MFGRLQQCFEVPRARSGVSPSQAATSATTQAEVGGLKAIAQPQRAEQGHRTWQQLRRSEALAVSSPGERLFARQRRRPPRQGLARPRRGNVLRVPLHVFLRERVVGGAPPTPLPLPPAAAAPAGAWRTGSPTQNSKVQRCSTIAMRHNAMSTQHWPADKVAGP